MTAGLAADPLLLGSAVLLVAGVVCAGFAERLRAPGLLLFLGLGMVIGSDGFALIDLSDAGLAQTISVIALVVILYEGGLVSSPAALRPVAPPALVLATVGVGVTGAVVAAAASVVLDTSFTTALLIGSVVASTDAAAVFAVLRKAPLPRRLSALLEAESGSNDPMAILLTVGLLATVEGAVPPEQWVVFGLRQLIGGTLVGVAVGYVGAVGLNRSHLGSAGLHSVLGLGVAGLAYGVGAGLGTSGFLAVYVAGIVVAARSPRQRRTLRTFHEGLAATAQIGLFLLLGLLVFPAQLPRIALDATVIALVLVVVARPLAVLVCLVPFRMPSREVAFAGWAGLRGAVPIVLATFPLTAGYEDGVLIFDVVFFVVLVSAMLQGFTITYVAARLGLRAEPAPWAEVAEIIPLDTVGVDLFEVDVPEDAAVVGGTLAQFRLPGGARVSAIVRDDHVLVPNGGTILAAGDLLMIVSGPRPGLEGALGHWLAGELPRGATAGVPPSSGVAVGGGAPQPPRARAPAADAVGNTASPTSRSSP